MAGDWIKTRNNLWDDPRVSRICDLTGGGEACVIGGLYWLWSSADEHTENGYMPGLSLAGVDRKSGVTGLGAALAAVGWISDTDGGITINRFADHNGTSAKRRSTDAQRKAASRNMSASGVDKAETHSGHDAPESGAREEKKREVLTASIPDGIDVASIAADHLPARPAKPDCPHKEIIALYHEVLPMCPQVRNWTTARATQLRTRWNEDEKRQSLEYWRKFFEYVKTCKFLVGKSGKTPFFADLEWMTKAQNFTKIREEKYENRGHL